jgi:hypothetical protein
MQKAHEKENDGDADRLSLGVPADVRRLSLDAGDDEHTEGLAQSSASL